MSEDENTVRGNWSNKIDFVLSCLGYTVGLGNVWRFPYLAYSYGGAIFLIPYAIALMLIGIPMFFLELSLGQFTSSGPLTCWKMAPIAQGVGAAMLVVTSVLAVYYNIIIAWALYYLIASFGALPYVPWQFCNRKWATALCSDYVWKNISNTPLNCSKAVGYESAGGAYVPFDNGLCIGLLLKETDPSWFKEASKSDEGSFIYDGGYRVWDNGLKGMAFDKAFITHHTYPIAGSNFTRGVVGFWDIELATKNGYVRTSPSSEYFTRQVLRTHLSSGLGDLGQVHWDLALPLFIAWLLVFLCLIKGIKSSGKVVYFTAIFPYALLLTLMVRGLMMQGSLEGILYYLRGYGKHKADIPEDIQAFYLKKLGNIKVWRVAAEQTFFSLSTCFGGLITLASYNRFHNNIFRDAMILTLGDSFTSFFSGFVVFSFLGALAENLGIEVSRVTESGIGLAFIVYPEAVTHIPPSPVWSVLFFVMLLTLGLDSEFGLMETLMTAVLDVQPSLRPHKTRVIAVLCLLFYLLGLSMCCSGGIYVLVLLDAFGSGWNVLMIAVLECLTIAWLYSAVPRITGETTEGWRFMDDIHTMIGREHVFHIPWKYFKWAWIVMWSLITPILCLALMIGSLVEQSQSPLKEGQYVYETKFLAVGWLITVLVVIVVILGAASAVNQADCQFLIACKPTLEWGPALTIHRQLCSHLTNMNESLQKAKAMKDRERKYSAFPESQRSRGHRARSPSKEVSLEDVDADGNSLIISLHDDSRKSYYSKRTPSKISSKSKRSTKTGFSGAAIPRSYREEVSTGPDNQLEEVHTIEPDGESMKKTKSKRSKHSKRSRSKKHHN